MLTAQVLVKQGTPRLFINGKETPPVLFSLSDFPGAAANTAYAQKNIAQFARQGIHLIQADSELKLGWHKQTPFSCEAIQEEIASVIQADPRCGVILRLHLNPPYWWLRDHPEEQVLYDGKPGIDDGEQQRLIANDSMGQFRVSLASQRWLQEAGEHLRELCEFLRDTEEGSHVVGIQAACGLYGEWAHFGGGNDTSLPMQRRFHTLLREKYGTDEALQEAWGRNDVTLETAPFSPDAFRAADDGIFRDPVASRDVMDAYLCLQTVLAEDILYFSKIIKESWGRPVLTGAFYSYINSRHYLADRLFSHPELIDYLSGPFPYLDNRTSDHVPMQRGLLESVRLRGMLWLTEMDGHPAGTEHHMGGDPALIDETIAMLRRNVLQPILGGQGLWYYDHRLIPQFVPKDGQNPFAGSIYRKTGWWDNPVLLKEIRQMYRLARKYAHGRFRPAADVLLVYCAESGFVTSRFVEDEYAVQDAVARTGAAYDCIFLKELPRAQMDRYRCVIFTNAYVLTDEDRARIAECLAGKQVVWLYAAGYSDDRTLDLAHIERTTGICVRKTQPHSAYFNTVGDLVPLRTSDFEPMFEVCDPDAQPIARYEDNRTVAAARKGSSWYFAVPRLDPASMRAVFAVAGVHSYCDSGDPVMAGEGLVALNTFSGVKSSLTLRNGRRIPIDLPPQTTAIFDAETGERLDTWR